MFNFIKKYKERKQAEVEHSAELQNIQMAMAEKKIIAMKELMLSKPCPINKNEKCFDECVHFCDGHIYFQPSFYGDGMGFWVHISPKCKLWER